MADWPKFRDEDCTSRIGVHFVALRVHGELKWIFRETASSDLGIDGEIEVRESDTTSHGRVISVQVKTGASFLRETTPTGYVYRGSYKHLRYWTSHSTPVVLVLCDPVTGSCWWQDINLQKVRFHEEGWSIEVPSIQQLMKNHARDLNKLLTAF